MKTFIAATFFLFLSWMTYGQGDPITLLHLNQNRLSTAEIHAFILGGWAISNIVISGYFTWKLHDGEPEAFHHMNAAWNLVNLGVAWAMLFHINQANPTDYDLMTSVQKHYHTQKLMMLNMGLDLSYTLAGLWLFEKGKKEGRYDFMLRGFGKSLILQGAFLLLLDTSFYTIYASQNPALQQILQQLTIHADGIGRASFGFSQLVFFFDI